MFGCSKVPTFKDLTLSKFVKCNIQFHFKLKSRRFIITRFKIDLWSRIRVLYETSALNQLYIILTIICKHDDQKNKVMHTTCTKSLG